MRHLLAAALLASIVGCAGEAFGTEAAPEKRSAPDLTQPLYVHEQEQVTIKLMPSPCVDPTTTLLIVANFPPEMHARFRHLDSNWAMRNGTRQDFAGCWMEQGEELFIVFSDATGTRISKVDFTKRKGLTGT